MQLRDILNDHVGKRFADGLYCFADIEHATQFEAFYLVLRKKEGRLYPDEIVKNLPEIHAEHVHSREWAIRKRSMEKLIAYLSKRPHLKTVLEIGCGNGWLSNQLVTSLPVEVMGIDINEVELQQAASLFHSDRLAFVYTDINNALLPTTFFDVIILASSIQYFPSIQLLLQRLIELLSPSGEIHIIDSPICSSEKEAQARRVNSERYFSSLKVSEMSSHYFYHAIADFNKSKTLKHQLMFDPRSFSGYFSRKILRKPLSPFPWIKLTKVQ
jgi:ubiquinone/menaquinone biosynthesis C-methylase UbiE